MNDYIGKHMHSKNIIYKYSRRKNLNYFTGQDIIITH